jgi:TRAP-type C4-dicarboxylate transport system permease small subunit
MLFRAGEIIARVTAYLAGFVLIAMTAYTLIEIALRALLGISSNVLVEFVGYGLAAMTFLGAPQTMREGGLIRVNIALQFAPPRLHQVLDAFCLLCGIAIVAFGAYFVWFDMRRSFERGYETDSVVPLPLWLPPLGLFIGMVAFVLDMTIQLALVLSGKTKLADESVDTV